MSANEFREFVTSKFGESSAQFKALGQANTDWQDEIFKPLSVQTTMLMFLVLYHTCPIVYQFLIPMKWYIEDF